MLFLLAYLSGDREEAYRMAVRSAEVAPTSILAYQAAREALDTRRFRHAARGGARRGLAARRSPRRGGPPYAHREPGRDGVRGVYAQTNDIQWQILFYGEERIPTRGASTEDRYPRFPEAVDAARRAGQPTAYIADVRQLGRELPSDSFPGYRVGERYLRLDDPDLALLLVMGFQTELGAEER